MSNEFDLNKPGWFTPQNVAENEFLNGKLTDDKYGKWYSVQFEGNAETYLQMAKTAPVIGQKMYGHLELTSSGKATKFKKDKIPEGGETPSQSSPAPTNSNNQSTDESIARAVALKAAVEYVSEADVPFVLAVADDFLAWLKGGSASKTEDPATDKVFPVKKDEPINLDDIPF